MSEPAATEEPKITVAGVSFTAEQVVSVVVKVEGRLIRIEEKENEPSQIGFK